MPSEPGRVRVEFAGIGHGSVSTPDGKTCTSDCVLDVPADVRGAACVTASPDADSTVWDTGSRIYETSRVTVCAPASPARIRVFFDTRLAGGRWVSVQMGGAGVGHVVSTPAGIDYPGGPSAAHFNGPVTLEGTPLPGSETVRWGGACAGAATTCELTAGNQTAVAWFSLAPAAVEYKVERYHQPRGFYASGADEAGNAFGSVFGDCGYADATVLAPGALTLGATGPISRVTAGRGGVWAGTMAGCDQYCTRSCMGSDGFLLRDGVFTDLGRYAWPAGIASDGSLVGSLYDGKQWRAARWSADGSSTTLLAPQLTDDSGAIAANSSGVVVGAVGRMDSRPAVFQGGSAKVVWNQQGALYAINESGTFVGSGRLDSPGSRPQALVGSAAGGGLVPSVYDGDTTFRAVDANGDAVGSSEVQAMQGVSIGPHAVVYRGEAMVDLNTRIDDRTCNLKVAFAFTAAGEIVAAANCLDGDDVVRLVPIQP